MEYSWRNPAAATGLAVSEAFLGQIGQATDCIFHMAYSCAQIALVMVRLSTVKEGSSADAYTSIHRRKSWFWAVIAVVNLVSSKLC